MRRLNKVGSLFGMLLSILLFVGLGISLWFNRGLAFNPGPVTAKSLAGIQINGYSSHTDFEKQCGKCHDPLRTNLASRCLECHRDVQVQLQTGQGAHSQISAINQCATCHPDHRGRSFDPTLASFQQFDHTKTKFSLIRHQENYDTTPMQCSECHSGTDFSVVANQTCLDCHSKKDENFKPTHPLDFGQDCLGCHDGVDRMQNFNHSTSGFPLDGKHTQIKCTDCHNPGSVKDTPKDCKTCHAEPAVHQGLFLQACDTCHSTQAWSPVTLNGTSFGHFMTTGFSLALHKVDYAKNPITCISCHPKDLQTYDLQICIECHAQNDAKFISDHIQQYTDGCLTCHDGIDRLSNFQHANFFVLDGKHASLQCADCHSNQVFRGTPNECWQCHKEPEIHKGIFGLKCYYCHDTLAWSPASLLKHGFPLNHGLSDNNSRLACDTCHGANYIEYTCYTCHDHVQAEILNNHLAAGIQEQDIPACAKCHPDGVLPNGQK